MSRSPSYPIGWTVFHALVMLIFDKRANCAGAIFGMLSGLLFTLLSIFWCDGWFFSPGTAIAANRVDNWVLGISPESIGAVGALVNFAVAYFVSHATAAPPEHIQHLVEDIRVPKGAAEATAH
jgi:cation/acetate symporter